MCVIMFFMQYKLRTNVSTLEQCNVFDAVEIAYTCKYSRKVN
jgi:hypothetical protein